MKRLLSTLKIDVVVQVRNQLYTIGIVSSVIIAIAISQLFSVSSLKGVVPAVILLVIGGTTMLYIGALILFEKDEGTLNAAMVSPLRASEYLWSKVISLNLLATLETVIMVGGALAIMRFSGPIQMPQLPLLFIGIVCIGVVYTLIGIILIVRYNKITNYLIPMAAVAMVLQLPFLYFWGLVKHPVFLVVPTSAPAMLIQGAFTSLPTWQWLYGIAYTAVLILGLGIWSYRAFHVHIIQKVG